MSCGFACSSDHVRPTCWLRSPTLFVAALCTECWMLGLPQNDQAAVWFLQKHVSYWQCIHTFCNSGWFGNREKCNGHSVAFLTGTNSWKVVWSLLHFELLFSARLEWHSWYSNSPQAGLSIDRILVGGKIFCTSPDQLCGPPSFLYSGHCFSVPGVQQLGPGIHHSSLSRAQVKERVGLCLYAPAGPSWPVLGWN